MIYGIDSFTVLQSKESVTFVRAGDSLGWFSHVNGNRYGDWVKNETTLKGEEAVELFCILADQAAATIARLTGRGETFERELALGMREQIKQAGS